MGIKNMPDFDDIDVGSENTGGKPKSSKKSGIDIKALFSSFGITTKEQLVPIFKAFGYDDATIEAMLSSFSSLDDLQEALDALDDDSLNLQNMLSNPMMNPMQPQVPPTMRGNTSQSSRSATSSDIYTEDEWEQADIDALEEIIDRFLNSTSTSEECVNELCELLADLDYCFSGDLQHIEDTLDNMRSSGTTTSEIKKFISSAVEDLCDSEEEDDSDPDADYDDTEEDDFGESTEEKQPKQIKMFKDNLQAIVDREDKLFSIEYVSFSAREFKNHFDIDEDDLEDNKIPISKFAELLPEEWTTNFEFVTLATSFIEEDNKFILCYLVPNFNSSSAIPVSFLIYKNSSGFHIYVVKSENIVNDDGSLLKLEDVYTDEAIDLAKKELEAALAQEADPMSMMGLGGMVSGGLAQPQTEVTDSKLNKTLYRTLLHAIGGYDEKRMFERCSKLMIKENYNPLMTLHILGTLTTTLETKQYGNGFVYVGDVTLNDSEDVKYFLSDFDLKPVNGKLEFYVKMENSEIKRNDLPKYKDYIRDHFDFNDDAIQNHLEVQVYDNIVYIEF